MSTVDRRRALVESARTLFAERPYEHVTTTAIAKHAGVAYGLIAHHFANKRGLYLAVMADVAAELSAAQDTPPRGTTVREQLRAALTDHVRYMDGHAAGFVAIMRGGLGADPDLRAMFDELRWNGVSRILRRIGITDPVPVVRAAMRGWAAGLDELMLDRIEHGDNDIETIVELAAAQLATALGTARRLDAASGIPAEIVAAVAESP